MKMRYLRTVEPAVEPVSLTEAKLHCRVDLSTDDTLLTALIVAAREYVEEFTRKALITQTWRLSLDQFPLSGLKLPRPPLQSITSISYTDGAGTVTTVSNTVYTVDTDAEPGRLLLNYNQSWPTPATMAAANPIKITYVAGYGLAVAVPQKYKQAILMLVGHWYENREASSGQSVREIPMAVESLLLIDRNYS